MARCWKLVPENDWDALINREDLESVLTEVMRRASGLREFDLLSEDQNFLQSAMPRELQDANPRKIWRMVDGALTREPISR